MKATALKSVLSDLAGLLRAGTAKRQADDVDTLAERIDDSGGKSAAVALNELEVELVTDSRPTQLSPKRYIREFRAVGLDEAAFRQLFERFRADKSIRKADAMEVMRGYAGKHKRAKTKAEAIEEVERRFYELVYDDNSRRQASSTTPW